MRKTENKVLYRKYSTLCYTRGNQITEVGTKCPVGFVHFFVFFLQIASSINTQTTAFQKTWRNHTWWNFIECRFQTINRLEFNVHCVVQHKPSKFRTNQVQVRHFNKDWRLHLILHSYMSSTSLAYVRIYICSSFIRYGIEISQKHTHTF